MVVIEGIAAGRVRSNTLSVYWFYDVAPKTNRSDTWASGCVRRIIDTAFDSRTAVKGRGSDNGTGC